MESGGRDVWQVLESYQEKVVEESPQAGEAHLGEDQDADTGQVGGIIHLVGRNSNPD